MRRQYFIIIDVNIHFALTHAVSVISAHIITIKIKVKESRNRPRVAQRVPGGLDSQIFMTFGT